jgi:hypothetical protein
MTPLPIAYQVDFSWQDEQIAQLKEQDAAARQMAHDAAELLKAILPRTNLIENLRASFVEYVCCGTERQIAQFESQKRGPHSYPVPAIDDEEALIRLVDERNQKQEEIDRALAPLRALPEDIRPMMQPMLELAINNLLGPEVRMLDQQIGALQRRLEERPQNPVETETAE